MVVPRFRQKPGQRFLDVGIGIGLVVLFILKALGPPGLMKATDHSENMTRVFKTKVSGLRNVSVQLKDVKALNTPSESFNAAVCFELFSLNRREKAQLNLNRVLGQVGRFIITHSLNIRDKGA